MRYIEHGQTTDQGCNQREKQYRTQARERDAEEGLKSVSPVYCRGLEESGIDARNACDQDDHGVAVPHPELDKRHNAARRPLILKEEDRGVGPSQHLKQTVYRAHRIGKQRAEKHGDRTCSNDIRHIEQHFKHALPLDVKAAVREPCGKQECKHHLGNEVEYPEQPRVDQRLPERSVIKEEVFEILKRIIQKMNGFRYDPFHIGESDHCGV